MAKKKASKKAAAKKTVRKKTAARAKSKVAKKKAPAAKKTAKKKVAKAARKARQKAGVTKKTAKKAGKKKAAKKTVKKKAAAKKKTAARKPTSKKKAAKKATAKKAAAKKTAAKKKSAASKKATAKKSTAAGKSAAKKKATKAAPKKSAPKKSANQSKRASSTAKSAQGVEVIEPSTGRDKKEAMAAEETKAKPNRRRVASDRTGVAVATARASGAAPKAEAKPAFKNVTLEELDRVELEPGYRPQPDEEYMSVKHLAYFKRKLDQWRDELIVESQETLEHLRSESRDVGDEAERASRESDNILELRTRDRYRKLLRKIDQAIERILDGSYGYCEETGEEIGVARLEARPIATLTVDAQERREMLQKQFRDDH